MVSNQIIKILESYGSLNVKVMYKTQISTQAKEIQFRCLLTRSDGIIIDINIDRNKYECLGKLMFRLYRLMKTEVNDIEENQG